MWQKSYSTVTDVPSAQLWAVVADISNWAAWHEDIESTQITGLPQPGAEFQLKAKAAPVVKLIIEKFAPPHRFVDLTQFPLAQMRTIHEFSETATGTEIKITVQVWGILGWLWRKIVAQGIVDGLAIQTQLFIERARNIPG
jgi:hypothetical protein